MAFRRGSPLDGWLGAWIDALLPPACAACGARVAPSEVLCPDCTAQLPTIAREACPRCQMHPRSPSGRCSRSPHTDPLDAAVAPFWLEPPVSDWIHAFKYPERGLRGLAPGPLAATRELARRAVVYAPGPAPDVVVPVPLHRNRLRQRGFNPARELAASVAREAGARLAPKAIARVRDTPSQTGLDAGARKRNLRDALSVPGAVPERVWLVDDVITTGATTREAARALRVAGALHVVALAAARTPLHREESESR